MFSIVTPFSEELFCNCEQVELYISALLKIIKGKAVFGSGQTQMIINEIVRLRGEVDF